MATCEKREIKPDPPPVEYVLTLTEDEARWLVLTTRSWSNAYAQLIHDSLRLAGAAKK